MPAKPRTPLRDQFAVLGVPIERVELPRVPDGWHVDGQTHHRPEHAAAALSRAEGWTCATCEGGPMLL